MSEENSTEEPAGAAEPEPAPSNIGRIEWIDLTVDNAESIKSFYTNVVGWKSTDVEMGNYSDFNINLPETGDTVAGICHARGMNANMPSQWLIYVRVKDVTLSAAETEQRGGKVLDGPRRMGGSNFCVIEDPAGAVLALLSD